MLKKFQTTIWLITCGVILKSLPSSATHLAGGEITCKCLNGGMYKIQLKVFGPCVPSSLEEVPYALFFNDLTVGKVIGERKLIEACDNYIPYSSVHLSAGMHMVNVGDEKSFVTKKLIIQ